MYEFNERVRYSETDEHEQATILSVVNYLQDCSTFHSTEVGLTVDYLREMKRAWLLSYWDIYIERMPKLCERLTIGTCPHAFRGVLAHRNFWIKDEARAYILRADSLWFCYDTERMRPAKITEDMLTPFGEMRDVLELPASERKIMEPDELTEAAPILVQPHHIDSNHHVNNAQYIAIADEVLTEAAGGQERLPGRRDQTVIRILVHEHGELIADRLPRRHLLLRKQYRCALTVCEIHTEVLLTRDLQCLDLS